MRIAGDKSRGFAGAQVPLVQRPPGLLFHVDAHPAQRDVLKIIVGTSMQEYAVLAAAVDVFKPDVADMPGLAALLAVDRRHADGLAFAPPLVGELAGVDVQVGEKDILDAAAVAQHQRDTAVCAGDHAVGDRDVAEVGYALGAELDGRARRGQRAVADHNVLAGAECGVLLGRFKDNAVIGGLDMAVADPHIAAVVRVNAIAVDHFQVIQNADAIDQHILAADQMHGPERTAGQGDIADGQMAHTLHQQHRDAGVVGALDKIMVDGTVEVFLRTVNGAGAAEADILGILGHKEVIFRLTVIFAVFIGGNLQLGIAVSVAVGGLDLQEIRAVLAGLQPRAMGKVQLHMAVQQQRA